MPEVQQAEGYEFMTMAEAAAAADRTTSTMKQQARSSRLQAVKRGKQWFTTRAWLEEYLGSRHPGKPGEKNG